MYFTYAQHNSLESCGREGVIIMAKTSINLAGLSLSSTGASHGVPYTAAEKRLNAGLVCALLMAANSVNEAGVVVADDKIVKLTKDEEKVLAAVVEATPEKNRSLPGLVSAAYKANFKALFGKDAVTGNDDFPKLRDPTSQRLLLRQALKDIGREDILPSVETYGAKKKVSA